MQKPRPRGRFSEAERKAEEIINSAKADAEFRRGKAQRGTGIDDLITAEEKKAKKDAENVVGDYRKKVEELTKIPKKNLDEAIDLILKEVLPK